MSKIIDCITFFNENFIFELRYKILEKVVDQFVVCESKYDHKGDKKELNFKKENYNDIIPLESYINLGKCMLEQNDDNAISAETYISFGSYMSELS